MDQPTVPVISSVTTLGIASVEEWASLLDTHALSFLKESYNGQLYPMVLDLEEEKTCLEDILNEITRMPHPTPENAQERLARQRALTSCARTHIVRMYGLSAALFSYIKAYEVALEDFANASTTTEEVPNDPN